MQGESCSKRPPPEPWKPKRKSPSLQLKQLPITGPSPPSQPRTKFSRCWKRREWAREERTSIDHGTQAWVEFWCLPRTHCPHPNWHYLEPQPREFTSYRFFFGEITSYLRNPRAQSLILAKRSPHSATCECRSLRLNVGIRNPELQIGSFSGEDRSNYCRCWKYDVGPCHWFVCNRFDI
ncbi:hypothetical protein ACFX2G_046033 [Malus domestica]